MSVSQNNPAIAEAWGVLKTLSADEEARLLAESREKARMDFEDRYNGAYREGEQTGKVEIARNALREKMPVDTIAKLTGLSPSEIEQLASEL